MERPIIESTMIYDPDHDVWKDEKGRNYIKNEFKPWDPVFIDITRPDWRFSYRGQYWVIDWKRIKYKPGFYQCFQSIAKSKLKKNSFAYANYTEYMLRCLAPLLKDSWYDFSDLSVIDLVDIWKKINSYARSALREYYTQMALSNIGGARCDIAIEMKSWKARSELTFLRDVLQWHETRGALVSSEEKILRAALSEGCDDRECDKHYAARIFAWLLLDTLKRPSQILDIRKDGIREVVDPQGHSEWFVEIRPVKYQTGLPYRWWRISDNLAKEIHKYSERKSVAILQSKYDRLIVWATQGLAEHGVVSSDAAKRTLASFLLKKGLVSPRTGEILHVTPTRIRHTGATRLAFQGVSRDLLQEILEHDNSASAQYYIDAVGVEIVPAIEKAGRKMGNIFRELNRGYFQGRIVPKSNNNAPVVVPELAPAPIIVGNCSRDTLKDGVCPKHPFLSCYDGCTCFFAWDSPDPHHKALLYFEKEIERWEISAKTAEAEDAFHAFPSRMLGTYQRAANATREVLKQINQGASRA